MSALQFIQTRSNFSKVLFPKISMGLTGRGRVSMNRNEGPLCPECFVKH